MNISTNTEVKLKILLVDDENAIITTVKTFLELSGFTVITAQNGTETLDSVEQHHPDLILDVLKPKLDGRETLRRCARKITGHQ